MPNSPHITNPRAPSQYFVLFCSKLQFYECVNTFSMDTELRNDRIPRNPFDRQFLDMTTELVGRPYNISQSVSRTWGFYNYCVLVPATQAALRQQELCKMWSRHESRKAKGCFMWFGVEVHKEKM